MSHDNSAAEILAIADNLSGKVGSYDIRGLARRAIDAGTDVESFRAAALSKISSYAPVRSFDSSELSERDWRRYSLTRAIQMQMPGAKRDGIENELSVELTRRQPGMDKPEGLLVPDQVWGRNMVAGGVTITSNTLGGALAIADNNSSEFIEILRNKSQVLNLGARSINLSNSCVIPRQYAAGVANWVGETVASTLTNMGIQNLTLQPQAISAYHQYSRQLLMQSNPSIDALIRDDITQTLAIAIDLAAIHGTGSGQPTGIVNTTGINTVALASNGLALGNSTAYAAMVSLESLVAASNADTGSLAYLMRPGHRGALRTQQRFSNTDSPVWNPLDNKVNGYRAEVSNQIATNLTTGTATTICSAIIFGNWNDLLIASFGSTDLVIDPYSAGSNGVVRLYARRWCDISPRHPASFAVLGGVLTT